MRTKRSRHIKNKTRKIIQNKDETQLIRKECKNKTSSMESFEKTFEKGLGQNLTKQNNIIQRELIRLFNVPFSPSKYTPRNDYYTYINYEWITNQTKQLQKTKKFYVQVDSFRIAQEKVYYELIDITKEHIKNNHGPKAKQIKNLYESMLHLDEQAAQDAINETVKYITGFIAEDNLYKFLAQVNWNETISWGCPIVWSVMKDEKHSDTYRSNIGQPQLTAYDYVIYIEDDKDDEATKKYKRQYKKRFLEFVKKMFNVCLGSGHGFKAQDVWDIEFELLIAMGCESVKNESPEFYNVVKTSESLKKYGFDFARLARELGYREENIPSKFICSNLSYLKCVMEMLEKDDAWKSKKWLTYYYYIVFRQIMRFHKKWRFIYYEFHGRFIKGQPKPWPDEIYPVFGLSLCFNTFLTNEYVRRNKKTEYIDYVTKLGTDLLEVFKRIIKRNTWLSPKTKKYALLKLEHIKLIVGNPILLREDPSINYDTKRAYQNIRKVGEWRTRRFIELDGKKSAVDIPSIDWEEFKLTGSQAYIVNAYYTPVENTIYIPLGYLQKPFIDLEERGIEYNLAHVGYTLGHEMSHSLDDMGSKFDYKGNLHNWWTPEDRHQFDLKVKNVIKQYETFAAYDGIKMDGSLSTGENLADISGIAICMEYLRDFQEKNSDIVPIKSLSFQAFFVYLALQARQKIFDKAIKAQLKVNPHPMDKYRTNCPLARLELFRSLYNIKKGDKMYWESTDTIW
jgi:putative endopeptidase